MNLKYLLISALLGGLASFAWGAAYHAGIGIDERTMGQFDDGRAVSEYIRSHTSGNGMYVTKEGVLAAVNLTADMSDRSLNMGPQLVKQYVINAVAAGLLAWLLLFTSIRGALCAGGFFALAGLAASVDSAFSAWNWYNHSLPFTLAAVVDEVACFFVAGLVVGWARGKFAPPAGPA
jgi:hypothetical protein